MASSLLALAAILTCSHAAFPGPTTDCPSPNALHVVRWTEPSSDRDEHHLFLRDVRGGRERELLRFSRHVEIFWSPSGTRLAVTDARSSDESTVLLWTDLGAPPVDLRNELAAQERQQVAGWDTHHLYLEVKGWAADGKLRLRLWGYEDPSNALDRRYVYTLGKGFSRK